MDSYFSDRDIMYVGKNDTYYSDQPRSFFVQKINNWLCTDNGVQATNILHSIREGTRQYKIDDSTQLNEDIIYLLYKYADKNIY